MEACGMPPLPTPLQMCPVKDTVLGLWQINHLVGYTVKSLSGARVGGKGLRSATSSLATSVLSVRLSPCMPCSVHPLPQPRGASTRQSRGCYLSN